MIHRYGNEQCCTEKKCEQGQEDSCKSLEILHMAYQVMLGTTEEDQ